MNKLVLWLLFDDGNCSYAKSILEYSTFFANYDLVKAYSIGINDLSETIKTKENISWEYKKINLSLANIQLIKELSQLPKPDIILASPPCESFSMADCSCRRSQTYDSDKWVVRSREWYRNRAFTVTAPNKTRDFINKERNRLIGEGCASGLVHIIEVFKPLAYVIENPRNSKIWEFLKFHWSFEGFKNITYYYNYDLNFSQKPTCFMSNYSLNLKKQVLKDGYNKNHYKLGNYDKRSSIPTKLIADILKQIINKFNDENKKE
ncbi:C-5 cytosine-specific DNA methyltransferase [Mycoplasmopsis agalactiae]|uniref:C-5 cytosine-specific DNA methyltransferase n=1 Tax=Mycoplasmopsis agalactiae TaxID=2110 RepID=UPI002F943BEB